MAKASLLQHITIDRIEIALNELLTKPERLAALKSFKYGVFIEPELTELRDKITALPPAAKKKPLAGELANLDGNHDGFGAACWFLVQAYLRAPSTTDEQRDTLNTIREFLGTLDETTATYDAEAKAAKNRNEKLATFTAALSSFPIAGNKTLLDWANGYIGAGIAIGEMLSQRADAKDRENANMLRNDAVGVLNETRRQLRREQKKDSNLPTSLEGDVFAWFDDLEKASAQEAAEEKKKAAAPKADAAGGKTPGDQGGAGGAAGAGGGS